MSRPTYFILVRGKSLEDARESAEEALEEYRGVIHNYERFLDAPDGTDNWHSPTNAADMGLDEFLSFIASLQADIAAIVRTELGDIKTRTLEEILKERKDDVFRLVEAITLQAGQFTFDAHFYNVSEDSTRLSKRIEVAIRRSPDKYWLLPYDLKT